MSEGTSRFGRYYWTIQTADAVIRLCADRLEVTASGALLAARAKREGDDGSEQITMAFAPGQWEHFYAASALDGTAVAVDHWDRRTTPRSPSGKRRARRSSR